MGFSQINIGLCIVLCFMASSCACAPRKIWAQGQTSSHDEQVHSSHHVSPTLARKLMQHHGEEAKFKRAAGDEHYLPFKIDEHGLSGKAMHKKEEDPSEFESMEDYNPEVVKKRRPVHNRLPVAP